MHRYIGRSTHIFNNKSSNLKLLLLLKLLELVQGGGTFLYTNIPVNARLGSNASPPNYNLAPLTNLYSYHARI